MFLHGVCKRVLSAVLAVLGLAGVATADLDIPKWLQQPDLTVTGMDVDATSTPLADDFLCYDDAPVTDVHIWGSWRDDLNLTDQTTFRLAFYDDIPAGAGGLDYSRPDYGNGPVKEYSFAPGEYAARLWHTHGADALEDWYSPESGQYVPDNHAEVWQYNFLFPDDPFFQAGSGTDPAVYWLQVQAVGPAGANAAFGWKTSLMHWNDDAVYLDPEDGPQELRYPSGFNSPYAWLPQPGDSIDLAFAITPEPGAAALLAIGGLAALLRRRRR